MMLNTNLHCLMKLECFFSLNNVSNQLDTSFVEAKYHYSFKKGEWSKVKEPNRKQTYIIIFFKWTNWYFTFPIVSNFIVFLHTVGSDSSWIGKSSSVQSYSLFCKFILVLVIAILKHGSIRPLNLLDNFTYCKNKSPIWLNLWELALNTIPLEHLTYTLDKSPIYTM